MASKALKEAIERAETWPEEAQEQVAEIAFEIDAELKGGVYHATSEELTGIDRGLKAAREGRLATDDEIEAVFTKRRGGSERDNPWNRGDREAGRGSVVQCAAACGCGASVDATSLASAR